MYNGEEVTESEHTWLYAYKEKISPSCDSSTNKKEIKCEKWNIIVDSAYKYTTCNAPWNCWAYTKNGYNEALNIAPWNIVTVTKEIPYNNEGFTMWKTTYTQEIQCNTDWLGYTEIWAETSSLTCTAPYIDDVPWVSCKIDIPTCEIWDLTWWELVSWKCVIDIDFNSVNIWGIHNITKNIPDDDIELKIEYTDWTEEKYDNLWDTIRFNTVNRGVVNWWINIFKDWGNLELIKANISKITIYETDWATWAWTPVSIWSTGCDWYSSYKIHSWFFHMSCKEYLNNVFDADWNNVKCAEKQFWARIDLDWTWYLK
jgi:hypothetical protein